MIKENIWIENLIWCPSQCYYYFINPEDNQRHCIYLRWRYRDPWTSELVRCNDDWDWELCESIKTKKKYIDSEYRELEKEILEIIRRRFPRTNFIDEVYEEKKKEISISEEDIL